MSLQNLPLWHKYNFELKAMEKKQIKDKFSVPPFIFQKAGRKFVHKLVTNNPEHLPAPVQPQRTLQNKH